MFHYLKRTSAAMLHISSVTWESYKPDLLDVVQFSIRFNDGDGLVLHGGELLKGSILVEVSGTIGESTVQDYF